MLLVGNGLKVGLKPWGGVLAVTKGLVRQVEWLVGKLPSALYDKNALPLHFPCCL